jgi:electron transport complex protein RnfA
MEFVSIIILALFVNNVVLSQFLGICPFLGVSNKIPTALGMGAAVIFVMVLANLVTYLLYTYLLVPMDIAFMQTISFILVIAALVQMVEIILKKVSPPLYQALGIFLPLITTNCAVMGTALVAITKNYDLIHNVFYAAMTGVGFTFAMVIMAGLREQLALVKIPKSMQGASIVLVTAGLLAMAFMGFSGMVK